MSLDPISAALDIGSQLITRLFPDPAQQSEARLKLLELQQSGVLAQLTADTDLAKGQLAVNQTEASNANLFVAGWRPFIGWICGSGLGYMFVLKPVLSPILTKLFGVTLEALDTGTLMSLIVPLLGLGAMRTAEVITGAKPRGM
jgi:hypothetical protein